MRFGSLFSGYGGLDLGVQSVLGGTTAWFCEFDKAPSKILAHHWPDVPNLGDITKIDWATVEPVDVLTGGFPCQDVSHAGRRAGLIRDGEGRTRSGLWGHMLRAVDQLRPRLVVAENVRGLLSAAADSDVEPCPWCLGDANGEPDMRALGAVLADLADVGFDAWWVGLRAADVGAAHGRSRVFIFATPADAVRGGLDGWAPEQIRRSLVGAATAWGGEDAGDAPSLTLLPTPAVNDMGEGKTVEHWDAWTATMQAKHGNGNGHGKSLAIEAQRLLPTPTTEPTAGNGHARNLGAEARLLPVPVAALLPTPRATDGTKGGPNQRGSSGDLMLPSAVTLLPTPVSDNSRGPTSDSTDFQSLPNEVAYRWGDYAPAIARWEHATGRTAPAPTEPGKNGNPRLSPAFVEWLMGLPEGHITDPAIGLTRNEQFKAAGNGVVPQQAAAATRWWLTHITQERAA